MERELLRLAETAAARIRKAGLQAGTVQIKVRLPDFQTLTRQKRLVPPASGTAQLFHVARELLRDWLAGHPGARIRLLGVGGSRLSPAGQPDLFDEQEHPAPAAIDRAADDIRNRFGPAAVTRARTLRRRE